MVSKIQPFENAKIYTEISASDTSLLIFTFLNRCILAKTSLINTKRGDFVNIGVLFLTIA